MRDATRRRRFIAWFQEKPCKGDREKLIALTGYTKGRISQLFDENQPFGERAASNLAEKLNLRPDYFEGYEAVENGLRFSVAEPVPAPPPPPADFKDRHLVTDSEWATLNAVKLLMSDHEIAELQERARRLEERAREQLSKLGKAASNNGDKS